MVKAFTASLFEHGSDFISCTQEYPEQALSRGVTRSALMPAAAATVSETACTRSSPEDSRGL